MTLKGTRKKAPNLSLYKTETKEEKEVVALTKEVKRAVEDIKDIESVALDLIEKKIGSTQKVVEREVVVEKDSSSEIEALKKEVRKIARNTGQGGRIKGIVAGTGIQITEQNYGFPVISKESADTFETVSKNLDASDATPVYDVSGNLTSIEYANGITKTLNYTGDNLTSVVLSGSTPSGIDLTKTLSYTGDILTGWAYS